MTTVARTLQSEIWNNVTTFETQSGNGNSSTSGWAWNSTEQVTSPSILNRYGLVQVIGYPGPLFTTIHVAALTSLTISTVTIIILLIYLCGYHGSVKDHEKGTRRNGKRGVFQSNEVPAANSSRRNRTAVQWKSRVSFWNWNVGERLVIYLAVCDMCYAINHVLDHAYMLHTKHNPPEVLCAVFAFLLQDFIYTQWFIILAAAVSACSLVVFGRKMSLGRFDWKLITFAFGLPVLIGVITLSLGLLGASGAWCFVNLGTEAGRLYSGIVSIFEISLFGLLSVAYGAIWIKIQRTTKLMKGSTSERYQSSAKVMMIFVAAYILQSWMSMVVNVWGISTSPPPALLILAVILINLGGVYNSITYTIIRRRLQRHKHQNTVVSNNSNISASLTVATPLSVIAPLDLPHTSGTHVPDVAVVSSDASEAQRTSSCSGVPEIADTLGVPPDISEGQQIRGCPSLPEIPQGDKMASEGPPLYFDADKIQGIGPFDIYIHI